MTNRLAPKGTNPYLISYTLLQLWHCRARCLALSKPQTPPGNTFVEIPATVAAAGASLAPVLAAVGAISALVAKFKVVVVRVEPKIIESGEKQHST